MGNRSRRDRDKTGHESVSHQILAAHLLGQLNQSDFDQTSQIHLPLQLKIELSSPSNGLREGAQINQTSQFASSVVVVKKLQRGAAFIDAKY